MEFEPLYILTYNTYPFIYSFIIRLRTWHFSLLDLQKYADQQLKISLIEVYSYLFYTISKETVIQVVTENDG